MVSFVTPGYNITTLEESVLGSHKGQSTTCYPRNPAFCASFDNFAKKLVINDANNEEKCRKTREGMGFDKDHQFDTEVCETFNEHQCDPFFTGVDHSSEPLPDPPQFEMVEYTPVEYEAVEYEDAEYSMIDYEEFTK